MSDELHGLRRPRRPRRPRKAKDSWTEMMDDLAEVAFPGSPKGAKPVGEGAVISTGTLVLEDSVEGRFWASVGHFGEGSLNVQAIREEDGSYHVAITTGGGTCIHQEVARLDLDPSWGDVEKLLDAQNVGAPDARLPLLYAIRHWHERQRQEREAAEREQAEREARSRAWQTRGGSAAAREDFDPVAGF
jgi:hypothetical protein